MKLPQLVLCCLLNVVTPALTRADLAEGLLVSLPLQEDLRDHSAAKLPVNVVGNVLLRDGAAYFPGNGNWLELPNVPLDHRSFAVSLWVRPTGSFPTYGLVEQFDRNETGHILHLVMREGLHPWLGFYVNDTVSPIGLSNSGGWQHLVFQYADGCQEIWINGRLICRRLTEAYQGTSGVTCIGKIEKWQNVPGRDFEGYLSDVRFYGRALAVKEVRELAHTRPAESTKPNLASSESGVVQTESLAGIPLLSVNGGAMRVNGAPGEVYTVEASADLQKWEKLGVVTLGEEGYVDILDRDAGKFPQRFYRMRYGATH